MTPELRRDLLAIVLEEAFGYRAEAARTIAEYGGAPGYPKSPAQFETADVIVNRIDSRCSRIEG